MPFQGRTVQSVETHNYKGLNENASVLALEVGEALDMDNFEVDLSGAVQQRKGYSLVSTITGTLRYLGSYFTTLGNQVFVAVAGTSFWEASSISGPWTDRTGGVTLSAIAGPWVGTELNGQFVLVNGTDAPVYHTQGQNLQTLKTASLIQPPDDLNLIIVGANDGIIRRDYAITAITANGETTISNLAGAATNTTLSASNYNTLVWNKRVGAQGYVIYKVNGGKFQRLSTVGRLTNTYDDTGAALVSGGPPSSNTASNTPASWDARPPSAITTIAKGRAQRMVAIQGSTLYASGLSDCLDWETASDAFNLPIRGGLDNTIQVIGALYEYTILFSSTNGFIFTGSTFNDFTLVKILNVGCSAPHSLIPVGDELLFWSDLGPNSLARVEAGQDLQSAQAMSLKVQKTVHNLSNKTQWSKIVAWKDVRNQRVGWAYPVGTDTSNSKALIRGTANPGWSRHSMPAIVNAVVDEDRVVYVGASDGKIYKLYDGFTDNGVAITGSYETGWYDSQSNLNRYMDTLNVIMDKSIGAYSLTVEVFWDFVTTASSTHTITDTLTDGITVVGGTPTANFHSLYVEGMGRYFKLKFSVPTSSTTNPRILGWREELYTKGRR